MAGHPLRPATDHRPGKPLPHQLANPPQAPPKAPPKRFSSLNRNSASSCGLTHHFWWLSPTSGQIAHVFLTRPPREPPEGDPVRLACIRHAASVDPEPGSNSPPNSSCSPDSSLPQNLRQSWCLLFSLSSTPVNTLSPASRPCSPCPLDQCASSASSSAPHPTVPGQNSVRAPSSLLNPRCQASRSPSQYPHQAPRSLGPRSLVKVLWSDFLAPFLQRCSPQPTYIRTSPRPCQGNLEGIFSIS